MRMLKPGVGGADPDDPVPQTHVFGGTLAPRWSLESLYGRLARRVSAGGPVFCHAMAPAGGLGRTARVVERSRPIMEAAVGAGRHVRLAGHSLEGVVAWVLAHDDPEAVELIELWGAPVRGPAVARLFSIVSPAARSLAPRSRRLAQHDRPLDGPIVRVVYSGCDGIVVPPRTSSAVEGKRAADHFVTAPICPFSATARSYEPTRSCIGESSNTCSCPATRRQHERSTRQRPDSSGMTLDRARSRW